MSPKASLSLAQARRLALSAQGFGRPRVPAPDRRDLNRLLRNVGLLQIDSVNVVARAHYLPGWSRLGPYRTEDLDAMSGRAPRALFEYWAHEAALVPVGMHPLFRHRMATFQSYFSRRLAHVLERRPRYLDDVLAELRARGPLSAGALAPDQRRGTDNWGWNWTDAKVALEHLFTSGEVAVARRQGFERVYDVADRVIPGAVLALPTPDEATSRRELLLDAARHCGVATFADLADYYRQRNPAARPHLHELVEDGQLVQVSVEGWRDPAYVLPDVVVPRRIDARALLVPFDPVVWERSRALRLFDFHYRIEIYTPAHKRVHGYYVLPFLLGDQLVARVDLKAARAERLLLVRSAWAEPHAPDATAAALAEELVAFAAWLQLDDVVVEGPGDLAPALARALSPGRGSRRRAAGDAGSTAASTAGPSRAAARAPRS